MSEACVNQWIRASSKLSNSYMGDSYCQLSLQEWMQEKVFQECLKDVDMLDVAIWISSASKELNTLTLVKSWRKLLDHKASDKWSEKMQESEIHGKVSEEIVQLLRNIPGNKAFQMFEQLIDYVKQEEATPAIRLLFQRWKDIASKKCVQRAKQATIS